MVWQVMLESCIAQLAAHGPVQLGLTWMSSMLSGDLVEAADYTELSDQVGLAAFAAAAAAAAAAAHHAAWGDQQHIIAIKMGAVSCNASAHCHCLFIRQLP